MTDEITVRENTAARTYDDLVVAIVYEYADSRRAFTSTIVEPEFRDRASAPNWSGPPWTTSGPRA